VEYVPERIFATPFAGGVVKKGEAEGVKKTTPPFAINLKPGIIEWLKPAFIRKSGLIPRISAPSVISQSICIGVLNQTV
jgi:hypothetical protein